MEELIKNLYSSHTNIAYDCLKKLQELSYINNNVYGYFDEFAQMLDSKNSYIRTRGITLIACNAKWDKDNKINKIIDKYLDHIEDDKPITSRQCIKALESIVKNKPELIPTIKNRLLKINYLKYNDSMQALVFKDAERILELIAKIEAKQK